MRRRPHRVRTGVATLGAATLVAISGIAAGTASAAVKRQAIPGTHPGWATKANLRPDHTARVPAGDITVNVYLNSQNPTGLEQFAAAVSNPSSPQYDHYLNAA